MTESNYRFVLAGGNILSDEACQFRFVKQANTPNRDAKALLLRKKPVALEFTPVVPKVAQIQWNDPKRGWVNDQPIYRVADLRLQHPSAGESRDQRIFQVKIGAGKSILVELEISTALSDLEAQLRAETDPIEKMAQEVQRRRLLYQYQDYLASCFGRRS